MSKVWTYNRRTKGGNVFIKKVQSKDIVIMAKLTEVIICCLVCPNCAEPAESNCTETTAGYIGAVSFLSSFLALLLVVGAVLVHRYRLHQWIITKLTSSHSNRTTENADDEKSRDYEVVAIRRTNRNREISNVIAESSEGTPDRCRTRNFTGDDARPAMTTGSGGATLHPRQADGKPKKKRNDGSKLLFKHKTTHTRGHSEQDIELSNTVGLRSEQSNTHLYQSLLRRDDGNVDNGEEPEYSNVGIF